MDEELEELEELLARLEDDTVEMEAEEIHRVVKRYYQLYPDEPQATDCLILGGVEICGV